ncbi:MAG: TolC family protein [Phycisphaerales bacterium]|nr:TolC family protein [Phycisphaerales bacterium]
MVDAAVDQPLPSTVQCAAAVGERVHELLSAGLNSERASEVALLNNPRVLSGLARVGAARADVVQAGLFSNPKVSLMLRWPDGGGLTNLEMNVAQNIAELWQIPARKESAERDLRRVILDTAREAAQTALDARSAYHRATRAQREQALAEDNLEITRQLLEIALARREAGAGSEIDINLARALHLETELRLREARLSVVELRAALARVLGLTLNPREIRLIDDAAPPDISPINAQAVIRAADEHRLDLRSARSMVQAAAARVEYEKTRFLREIEVGISAERMERARRADRNWTNEAVWATAEEGMLALPSLMPRERLQTDWVIGPTLMFELPLFDLNDAQIARARYERRAADAVLEAIRREVVQDAWIAYERAAVAWSNTRFYAEELLPLEQDSLVLAREAYQAGRSSLLAVLDAQKTLLASRTGYVRAQEAAQLAAIELERVAGCSLQTLIAQAPSGDAQAPTSQPITPAPGAAESPENSQ